MRFLLLAILLPFASMAQDCGLKNEVDKFSQQKKLSTGFMKLNSDNGTVMLNIEGDAKEIRFLFVVSGGACFEDESTAVIAYDSTRTKSTQKHVGTMNCEGFFNLVFRNSSVVPTALSRFTKFAVANITLTDNTKNKILITPTPEQKELLRNKVACMIEQSKGVM